MSAGIQATGNQRLTPAENLRAYIYCFARRRIFSFFGT